MAATPPIGCISDQKKKKNSKDYRSTGLNIFSFGKKIDLGRIRVLLKYYIKIL
jgi:hypothetical protein